MLRNNLNKAVLIGILACSDNKYPDYTNLQIKADNLGYQLFVISQGDRYLLGADNNPHWVKELESETKIKISLFHKGKKTNIYDNNFFDKNGRRSAPYYKDLLVDSKIIGAELDQISNLYWASVNVNDPVTLDFKVEPFSRETYLEDNTTTITLSLKDLQLNADMISGLWRAKEMQNEKSDDSYSFAYDH